MPNENDLQSVLIVSKTDKPIEFIKEVLPKNDFYPILSAANAGEAKRALINSDVDIVIINTPLGDDFGMRLAIDIVTERKAGVLLLVKTELYEEVSYKMEQYGVLTLTKALNRTTLYQTVKLLSATSNKIRKLEENAQRLEKRLHEMKTVNKAKGYLIEFEGLTEEEAHKFIEKDAMDNCIRKIDAAKKIIDKYEF